MELESPCILSHGLSCFLNSVFSACYLKHSHVHWVKMTLFGVVQQLLKGLTEKGKQLPAASLLSTVKSASVAGNKVPAISLVFADLAR